MKKEEIIRRNIKTVLSLLLIALFLCSSFVSSAADPGSVYDQEQISFSEEGQIGKAEMIRVPFPGVDEKINEWKFPYSDGFFSIPSDEFSITTARGSMGLTVSAFRSTKKSLSLQYRTHLEKAGFTNIYAFGYDSSSRRALRYMSIHRASFTRRCL